MHVLFCSYGNDSIALIQWAHESGLKDVTCLYSDTGWSASWWTERVAKGETLASERHGGRELWQPLVRHDDAMRDALLHRAGFDVLPHRSLECYPCINANIDDIRLLSEDRIKLIDITEKNLGFTRKGKPRVMFRTARRKGAVGIRAVVQWAAAPRPRDQMEMFPTQCDSGYCSG